MPVEKQPRKRTKSEKQIMADMAEFEEEWERLRTKHPTPWDLLNGKKLAQFWFMLARGWEEKP